MPVLNVTNYALECGQLVSAQVCSALRRCVLLSHEDELEPGSAMELQQFIHVFPRAERSSRAQVTNCPRGEQEPALPSCSRVRVRMRMLWPLGCPSRSLSVPRVPRHGAGPEPALLPALRAGVPGVPGPCCHGRAQAEAPPGTAVGSPGHRGSSRTAAAPAARPARARGSAGQRGHGAAAAGPGAPGARPSGDERRPAALPVPPEGSLSWDGKSGSATECRPAGSPSGYPLETAPRSSQSPLLLLPGPAGLPRGTQGSQTPCRQTCIAFINFQTTQGL